MEIQRETEFDCYRVNFGLAFYFLQSGEGEGRGRDRVGSQEMKEGDRIHGSEMTLQSLLHTRLLSSSVRERVA